MGISNVIQSVPNILTSSRLIATPFLGYAIYQSNYKLGLPIFIWCGMTDFMDGYLARKLKCESKIGSIIDPIADKLLVGTLTVAFCASGALTPSTSLLILGRDAGLMFGSIWKAKTLKISPSQIEMRPFVSSKINTTLQLSLLGLCLWEGYKKIEDKHLAMKRPLERIVQGSTIFSGLSYLVWYKQAFRIL